MKNSEGAGLITPSLKGLSAISSFIAQVATPALDVCTGGSELICCVQTNSLAKEELLIISPYFIPGHMVLDAICPMAMNGVRIKLLISYKSDSALVNAAARSFFEG